MAETKKSTKNAKTRWARPDAQWRKLKSAFPRNYRECVYYRDIEDCTERATKGDFFVESLAVAAWWYSRMSTEDRQRILAAYWERHGFEEALAKAGFTKDEIAGDVAPQ